MNNIKSVPLSSIKFFPKGKQKAITTYSEYKFIKPKIRFYGKKSVPKCCAAPLEGMSYCVCTKCKNTSDTRIAKSRNLLSELIAEYMRLSPQKDFHLEHLEGMRWQASSCYDEKDGWQWWYTGKTPEKAVQKLLDSLKKKPQ